MVTGICPTVLQCYRLKSTLSTYEPFNGAVRYVRSSQICQESAGWDLSSIPNPQTLSSPILATTNIRQAYPLT